MNARFLLADSQGLFPLLAAACTESSRGPAPAAGLRVIVPKPPQLRRKQPGDSFEMSDGRRYFVAPNGSFRRLDGRRVRNAELRRLKKAAA